MICSPAPVTTTSRAASKPIVRRNWIVSQELGELVVHQGQERVDPLGLCPVVDGQRPQMADLTSDSGDR